MNSSAVIHRCRSTTPRQHAAKAVGRHFGERYKQLNQPRRGSYAEGEISGAGTAAGAESGDIVEI